MRKDYFVYCIIFILIVIFVVSIVEINKHKCKNNIPERFSPFDGNDYSTGINIPNLSVTENIDAKNIGLDNTGGRIVTTDLTSNNIKSNSLEAENIRYENPTPETADHLQPISIIDVAICFAFQIIETSLLKR